MPSVGWCLLLPFAWGFVGMPRQGMQVETDHLKDAEKGSSIKEGTMPATRSRMSKLWK